jgi:hypothetical protein
MKKILIIVLLAISNFGIAQFEYNFDSSEYVNAFKTSGNFLKLNQGSYDKKTKETNLGTLSKFETANFKKALSFELEILNSGNFAYPVVCSDNEGKKIGKSHFDEGYIVYWGYKDNANYNYVRIMRGCCYYENYLRYGVLRYYIGSKKNGVEYPSEWHDCDVDIGTSIHTLRVEVNTYQNEFKIYLMQGKSRLYNGYNAYSSLLGAIPLNWNDTYRVDVAGGFCTNYNSPKILDNFSSKLRCF